MILHGTDGSPESNWFRWLVSELRERELEVWLPTLPNAKRPSLRDNADFVHANVPFVLDKDTLIIGHSSGAILALILVQEAVQPIGGVVAVSVFHNDALSSNAVRVGNLPREYAAITWDANDRLFDVAFDYEAIKKRTHKLLFVHSDTDPYVPLEQAQYVADNCGGEMVVIPDQGHFNLEQGPDYKKFPKLIELLEERSLL